MSAPLRCAVVGVGHFGAYHAEKLARHRRTELVAVADLDAARARAVAAQHGTAAVTDCGELIGRVDAVSVAVPTRQHEAVASRFLEAGCHVLVEKPIADDMAGAERMIELARDRNVVLQVGHLARFHGVIEGIAADIANPLFVDAVRVAPFKARGTDVNVVFDLMVHDLDLILTLVDAPLIAVDAAGAPVISESEDIASARLKFASGCIATIAASRISLKTERKMRIFQGDAYFTIDFESGRVRTIRRGAGARRPMPGVPDMDVRELFFEPGDALQREIDAFVTAVLDGTPPPVSGEDGLRALEAVLRVNRSLRQHAAFVAGAGAVDTGTDAS